MEAIPKIEVKAYFYLAMKFDEFYVTIDEFVKTRRLLLNLNVETIRESAGQGQVFQKSTSIGRSACLSLFR
ncbi:unnamed protein product [Angiostrongylus costaricensis]|uniref:Transcriptional regulator n=1 Tax=Angiostrongylus costaricensis TaxID=334426 RepID=A0A0R3PBJ2_ANGCS|nr:unnamed protein product [Angiostrongylus costaricensis]